MDLGWVFLGLALAWWVFLGAMWVAVVAAIKWMDQEVGPELDWDEFEDEPRLVSTCRELGELAGKVKEASHG